MIYQTLHLLTIEAGFKKLILNAKNFFSLNYELKESILIKGMKYVNDSNFQIRSIKIKNVLLKISKFQNISLISNKTLIYRIDDRIIIEKMKSTI